MYRMLITFVCPLVSFSKGGKFHQSKKITHFGAVKRNSSVKEIHGFLVVLVPLYAFVSPSPYLWIRPKQILHLCLHYLLGSSPSCTINRHCPLASLFCNMASFQAPRRTLRLILRNLKTNVPLVGGDTSQPARAFAVAQYRETSNASLSKISESYSKLLSDLKERKRLHYLDTGADLILTPKELSRRAAARAGLQLPILDEGHPSLK